VFDHQQRLAPLVQADDLDELVDAEVDQTERRDVLHTVELEAQAPDGHEDLGVLDPQTLDRSGVLRVGLW
jgi:hypothetical protein